MSPVADGVLYEPDVPCPAGDGVVLATDLYRPAGGGRHPAVLQRTPYDKSQYPLTWALLDPRKADPDIADELVRKDLGLVRPDEVIIPLE